MAKDNTKLKARMPRGLADRGPSELGATRDMLDKIRQVYELYGFEALETPFIEYTDALGKFLPDQDRPNEGVFSFQDDDDQWLSLRYDLTAPLARHVAENFQDIAKPYRSYRQGWVFRNEKPGPGRFRQFMQFDADTVGAPTVAADAEICMMAADTLEALGLKGKYVIKVNNRKVLDGVMEAIGLGGDENAGRRLTVLRAIDKFDKVGFEGVSDLLGKGRWENPAAQSGDFTKGAGLDGEEIDTVLSLVILQAGEVGFFENVTQAGGDPKFVETNKGVIDGLRAHFGNSELSLQGIEELAEIALLAEAAGYGRDRIRIDPSVVRGLEYYTGPVFEAELTFEVKDEKGRPVRFGSVGGGGRYDGLVGRFRGEAIPATGFSVGVSRLASALSYLNDATAKPAYGPVVVAVLDRERTADYMAMAKTLRRAGIRAETYLGNPKNNLSAQFKYADRRNSPCVIIQGSSELDLGEVQIKDLIEGKIAAESITERSEWRETRPAQFTAKQTELVEKVREVLARHGIEPRD
ncbi:MAG TPA: histidine--tRNA ligase [Ancylobacter sp.]